MDSPGAEATQRSNPEFPHFDSADHIDAAAEPEAFENSTVDPSYVIHLIRQFLSHRAPLDPVRSVPPEASRSKAAEGVFSGTNGIIIQGASQNIEGESLLKTGTIHVGQVAEKLATARDKVTDTRNTGAALESEGGSEAVNLIQENGNYLEENGNHTGPNGYHIQDNRDLSRKRSRGGGNLIEQDADFSDHLANGTSRSSEKLSETAVYVQLCKADDNVEDRTPGASGVGREVGSEAYQNISSSDEELEEAGCVLWDLAATESHAEFLVEHHILDVLLGFLSVPQSDRMKEICLGVFGNLACHSGPVKAMVATKGLVEKIVEQLFVDNVPSLAETCRLLERFQRCISNFQFLKDDHVDNPKLLSAGLHSDETVALVESINEDVVLERIMWMAANTLDSQLLEKCTELILAMVDNQRDAAFVLLPSLLRLGLPGLLTELISGELTAISQGTSTRRDVVLDIVLQIAEAISISDDSAAQLAASDKLFTLSCQVVCLSAKDEIGPSRITAMVLIANLLTEESGLIDRVLYDSIFLGRLLALVPFAGDDPGVRNALWSILGRICRCLVSTPENPPQGTSGVLGVLADGCGLLLDDLDVHEEDDVDEEEVQVRAGHDAAASISRGLQAKLATVDNLKSIMDQWLAVHSGGSAADTPLARSVRKARSLFEHKEVPSGSNGGRDSFGVAHIGDVNSKETDTPQSTSQVSGSTRLADGNALTSTAKS